MDLETLKITNRFREMQKFTALSPEIQRRLEQISELSDDAKDVLLMDAFNKALKLAEELTERTEYNREAMTLNLRKYGLGKIKLEIYRDTGEEPEGQYGGTKPFTGLYINPNDILDFEGILPDEDDGWLYLNDDGTLPEDTLNFRNRDTIIAVALDTLESLEVIQKQLVTQAVEV